VSIGDAVGDAAGIGINAASGNYLGAAIGLVGLGASIFGGIGQANAAKETAGLEKQKYQVSENTAQLEMQQNAVRRQAMEMSARRSQLETLRTAQRARAFAIQAGATQTGSLTGSGIQGGIAETENQGLFGLQGINQSLQSGRQMFGLDASIDANKIRMAQIGAQEADVQGNSATSAGIASIGGSLIKAGPTIGGFFKTS